MRQHFIPLPCFQGRKNLDVTRRCRLKTILMFLELARPAGDNRLPCVCHDGCYACGLSACTDISSLHAAPSILPFSPHHARACATRNIQHAKQGAEASTFYKSALLQDKTHSDGLRGTDRQHRWTGVCQVNSQKRSERCLRPLLGRSSSCGADSGGGCGAGCS